MPLEDPFALERFVTAQGPVYEAALRELRAGRKRTHWMWFIFPQLRGLGRSATAEFFGLSGLGEAQAYLEHPILGTRLNDCVEAVLNVEGRSLAAIFGDPDDLKFMSSMTLFAVGTAASTNIFRQALDRYCDGVDDPATLKLLVAKKL